MLRRLLSYLLLGSLPFLLNTCSLGCQECKDLPFTTQQREYFLDFKEGSYWIYRNVQNGDLDSVYFVSQDVYRDAGAKDDLICYQEYSVLKFKGLASNLHWGYSIKSWDNELVNANSDVVFQGNYNLEKSENLTLNGILYKDVMTIDDCCLSRNCYACTEKYFRVIRLHFARQIGLIRWEVTNHPQFGNATYELIRYKAIR